MEPLVDEIIDQWIQKARSEWMTKTDSSRPFDISKRIQYLTVDIITKLALGSPLGCVASDSDKYDFLETIKQGNNICQYFSVFHELNALIYYLTKTPILGSRLIPKAGDRSGLGRLLGASGLLKNSKA